MSKKTEQTARLLDLIQPTLGIPDVPESGTLLERGLVLVLQAHLPVARANAGVDALRKQYEDWNEARVAQAQEIAAFLAPRSGNRSPEKLVKYVPAARAVKAYLQEVYQKTHGLSLEFLRDDPNGGAKTLAQMPLLGTYLGSILLSVAEPEKQPITLGHIRALDRLGLITRTTSIKKAREAVAPLIGKKISLRFAVAFGFVADSWCDSRKPVCWECQLREECPTGKKVYSDWKASQEKQAAARAREHSRRLAQDARDAARAKREDAREKKKQEADKARRERNRALDQKRAAALGKKSKATTGKAKAGKAATGKATTGKARAGSKSTTKAGAAKSAAAKSAAAKAKTAKKKVTKKASKATAASKSKSKAVTKKVAKKATSKVVKKASKKAATRKKTSRR